MAFEHRDWPTRDDDDDHTDSDHDAEESDDGWTSESRCPECEHTKGQHALGCPNA